MSDLVTRLSMQANAFSNLDFWSGHEPSQEQRRIRNQCRMQSWTPSSMPVFVSTGWADTITSVDFADPRLASYQRAVQGHEFRSESPADEGARSSAR